MEDNKYVQRERKIALKVSNNTLIGNLLLSAAKFVVGAISGSEALISDGIHSASDVFSTLIVIIGVNIGNKKEDKEHMYGHERFESVASVVLSVILFLTGAALGKQGIEGILSGRNSSPSFGMLALATAFVSIIAKEWMYRYTMKAAKEISSAVLKADAWHHRSDALSSVGSFVGVLGAKMGLPVLDSASSVIICFFIFKAAYDIFKEAVDGIVDKSCDEDTTSKMVESVTHTEGVIAVDDIKTRIFGNRIYVDVEISADKSLSLEQAHNIAEAVHDKIESAFPKVKHCMVHVNPA